MRAEHQANGCAQRNQDVQNDIYARHAGLAGAIHIEQRDIIDHFAERCAKGETPKKHR